MEQTSRPGPNPENPAAGQPTPGQPAGGPGHGQGYRYQSLFWPLVLVGAGVIWLLYGLGVVSASNITVLGLVWPVFVVGIGVDLIVGRRSPATGAMVGVVTVGLVVVLMLVGSSRGWDGSTDFKTETLSAQVGQAAQARIEIGLSGDAASIHALPSASGTERPLLYANITHRGVLDFRTSGVTDAVVVLKSGTTTPWWHGIGSGAPTRWDIGLDPGTPLSLIVRASSGSSTVDLTGLHLRSLELDAGSGDSRTVLPAADGSSSSRSDFRLQGSSGHMDVTAPEGADFTMSVGMSSGDARIALGRDSAGDISLRGSSGRFTLAVPAGQALRIEVQNISSGDVGIPDTLVRVSGQGKKGVWQTPGYDSAGKRVKLVLESMSSGSVKVQMEG